MKNLFLLALFSATLISCRTAGEYFKRDYIGQCVSIKTPGLMACGGLVKNIPSGMIIPETLSDYEYAEKYYSDKEHRLFLCLKYKRCK